MADFAELKHIVLEGYRRQGVFPMARDAEDSGLSLVAPGARRALLPIADLHIPRRLRQTLKNTPYAISFNEAFGDVIHYCATTRTAQRTDTWISPIIQDLFIDFHQGGLAHSVEVWDANNVLIGGVYGLALGSLFCGESMFSHAKDASKIALVHLMARLHRAGFERFDAQFINPHLQQFGQYSVPQDDFVRDLPLFVGKTADPTLPDDSLRDDPRALLSWYLAPNNHPLSVRPHPSQGHDP